MEFWMHEGKKKKFAYYFVLIIQFFSSKSVI